MKKIVLTLLPIYLVLLSFAKADSSEQNPNLIDGSPEVASEINDFILSTALLDSGFSDKKIVEEGAISVQPLHTEPFTRFNISIVSTEPSVKAGQKKKNLGFDTVSLKGSVSFKSATQEERVSFIKECKEKSGGSKICEKPTNFELKNFSNLNVWVQIWKRDVDKDKSEKGDYLVDEFFATEDFNLTENEKKEFSVNWKIPSNLESGSYYMSFFVNSNKIFDLSGTPLTVFSSAAEYPFEIGKKKGELREGGIEIDKNSIMIKNIGYSYREPAKLIDFEETEETIPITFKLKNLSSKEDRAHLVYQVYSWGQTNLQEKSSLGEEDVTMSAGESKEIFFNFRPEKNSAESVYNLKITAIGTGSQSISNIRFVVKNKNRGIFRFIGLAKNNENSKTNPFFCVRNASWEGIFKGQISLKIASIGQDIRHEWKSNVNLNAETNCFAIPSIELNENYNYEINGSIFNEKGQLISENIFSSNYTSEDGRSQFSNTPVDSDSTLPKTERQSLVFLILLSFLALFSISLTILSKRKKIVQK